MKCYQKHGSVCIIMLVAYSLLGCSADAAREMKLKGVHTGTEYTSPSGMFSVRLNKDETFGIKEHLEHDGAFEAFRFQDKQGNVYTIQATMSQNELPDSFIDDILAEKENAEGKKAKTPSGEVAMVKVSLVRPKPKAKGNGFMTIVFPKNKAIFEVLIQSAPYSDPDMAFDRVFDAMNWLWKRSAFRGVYNDAILAKSPKDPRLPIIIQALSDIASANTCEFTSSEAKTGEWIVKMSRPGDQGRIDLIIGIKASVEGVLSTESIASMVDDRKVAADFQEKVFAELMRKLDREKISMTRTNEMDSNLLILPTKK